jgi:hypothetical protein
MAAAIEVTRARCNVNAEANILHYDELLHAMGNPSKKIIGGSLQQLALDLCVSGLSTSEAKEVVMTLARTPGLSPEAYREIAEISRNVAVAYGGDTLVRTVQLVRSVLGGVEGLINFGASLNAFKAEDIISFRRMDREGMAQYALARMLDQIHDHIPDHMSPDYRVRR